MTPPTTAASRPPPASAAAVVPWLCDVLEPASVIDVGCGVGTRLAAYRDVGVPRILGLDGEWALRSGLEIPPERFRAIDLANEGEVDERIDLAQSLEVAEHLSEEAADRFVALLTSLAPVVLFSAAIPGQGGEHHVNEQWPGYWASRMKARGYEAFDVVRRHLWHDGSVAWWYVQNTVLYVSGDAEFSPSARALLASVDPGEPMPLVHPRMLRDVKLDAEQRLLAERNRRVTVRRVASGLGRQVAGLARLR